MFINKRDLIAYLILYLLILIGVICCSITKSEWSLIFLICTTSFAIIYQVFVISRSIYKNITSKKHKYKGVEY
jgi:energy-coupling factor transporter transmembrane protein EcfT